MTQKHYNDLMTQADDFLTALKEWEEQRDLETNANENQCLRLAINDINRCFMNLDRARVRFAEYEKQQKEELLKRIETGSTTAYDAKLAKELLG